MKNGKKAKQEVQAQERYRVFTPRSYEDREGEEKTYWTRIGTAFKGEKSITILLDALPLNGRLVVILEEAEAGEETEGEDEVVLRKRR